jgi:ribosomal protein S18 acetylase RimI-like enzyme
VGLATAGAGGARIATAREVEIQRLGVSPDHRRRGIGRQLMLACLRLASGAQGCRVVLWTRPAMTEAQRLYTSLGFRRNPARDLVDRVSRRLVYELDLTSSTSPPG